MLEQEQSTATQGNKNNIQTMFNNCAPFIDCITEIDNTQVDNVKDLDVVILIYNLINYFDNYSKISESLCCFCRDVPHATINYKRFWII